MPEPSQPATSPASPPEPDRPPRASYANPSMRISDAERAEVSDRLSRHYGDGRLDEAEFGRRLDQAMHAVTQSDLNGLFEDLPGDGAGGGGPAESVPAASVPAASWSHGSCRSRPWFRMFGLAALVVIAAITAQALTHLFIPWILVAVVVVLCLRRHPVRHHHHHPPEA
ncbi:MAG: DUF1707 SHOCT-like domain-containing protein [Streptosporangiaceae bacterium]